MRIIFRIFFSLLFLLFGSAFFLQTPFTKNQIKKRLIYAAKEQNIDLSIGKIEGNLPFEWTLKNVSITAKETKLPICAEMIKIRFAVFPLLKKQLEMSHLKVTGGSVQSIPFHLSAMMRFDLERKKPIKISHFLAEGESLYIKADGKIRQDISIQEGTLAFYLPDLSVFNSDLFQGSLTGSGEIAKGVARLDLSGEELILKEIPLKETSIHIEAKRKKNGWNGSLHYEGGHSQIPLDGNCAFRYVPKGHLFSVEDFHLKGPQLHLFGKIDLTPSLQNIEGTIYAQCLDLSVLRPLFSKSYLKGRIGTKIDLQSFSQFQDLKCQIEVEDFSAYDHSCEALTLEGTLFDLFGDPRGEFSLEGTQIQTNQVELAKVKVSSTFEPYGSPFSFSIKGNWKDPLECKGEGHWQKQGKALFVTMDSLKGFACKKPLSLCQPCLLEWDTSHFKMNHFSLDIGRGHFSSRIDLTPSSSLIKIKAHGFPLEFIPLPQKEFSLKGLADFSIDLISWENTLQGNGNIALKRALLHSEGADETLTTKGSLQVHLSNNIAQLHGEFKATEGQFCHFFGTVPISYQHFPFKIDLASKEPFTAQVTAEGKLEELFDFINIGAHRLEGWLSTDLHISKTLQSPFLRGKFELQEGLYENYYTGTHLKDIHAIALAKDQTIHITELNASDGEKGKVEAKGTLLLNPTKHFPFSITAKLDKFATISFDTIAGKFSGEATISGNQLESSAKGHLTVAEATFRIPDSLPSVLPDLDITFVNPPESILQKKVPPPSVAPLALDIDLDVPGKAYVEGKGLTSELKGKLHITGTYIDIIANGTLQLVQGEYIFSGKVFDLTQGEVIFKDSPSPSAYLSLSGICDLPDVSVTVMLRGPLTSPKLTFQSSPQLPISSLLSQILFNKDISEISAIQALQIAQTVISLSKNSTPDILAIIRKNLGIDRLTIVTSENDPGNISLQIGKYLMRGVMLTLSQGAESRNVTLEVDLRKGIKLQAAVNEDQQGKFSLKWHHHY